MMSHMNPEFLPLNVGRCLRFCVYVQALQHLLVRAHPVCAITIVLMMNNERHWIDHIMGGAGHRWPVAHVRVVTVFRLSTVAYERRAFGILKAGLAYLR